MSNSHLDWPIEAAKPEQADAGVLNVPGSNIVLDLHGDPTRAKLVVFSDGNHHMALEETLQTFLVNLPGVEDIFYATTPPRVITDALKAGRLRSGNVCLQIKPHVMISPGDVLEGLAAEGLIGTHVPAMQSRGLSILVKKGNPKAVSGPADLIEPGRIRLALSNPVTEKASYSVYSDALLAYSEKAQKSRSTVEAYLLSDDVVKSQIIHHREIPQLVASGNADASLIYHHLALRYTRIFPDQFDLLDVNLDELPNADQFRTAYHIACVGDGGEFGAEFVDFYRSAQSARIYERHGLQPFSSP